MWRNVVSAVCLSVALVGPAAADDGANALTYSEEKSGWQLLFDGESLDGWRNYKKDAVSDGWKVQDGALCRVDKGAGDIITDKAYKYFELSLEYNISEEGNSGLMFWVAETEATPWRTGPEVQIQDNVKGHDPQKAGWLYQLYPAGGEVDATKPAGEWNQLYLKISPEQCEIMMNGVRYSRFNIGSPDWEKKVAASKFASLPGFGKADGGHICLQDHGDLVCFRNVKIRELGENLQVADPIDGTLDLKVVEAFPGLSWADWEPIDEDGKSSPLRPIAVTHANDGSGRIFVATQRGIVHVLANRDAKKTQVYADLSRHTIYNDRQNEEGFLGIAFHPKYAETGEFFAYYTAASPPHVSAISRFRVSKDDPNKADPEFIEELMRIEQPYWNHNGGTIAFGPDGYLYVGLGDGGSANDPENNAQNLGTLLGSILRIDVDSKADGKAYAIPEDNPFVDTADACPEIYAYGLRNIWRMSFDRETGDFWAADVGQNLWEEINIVTKGGNYGWNYREGLHPFGSRVPPEGAEFIDPVWEYDHEIGKSVTGGLVYRGSLLPELSGKYVYADYVSGKIWALDYDADAGQVRGNHAIPSDKLPILSFGDDGDGEIYFTIASASGRGIYTFARSK